MATASRVQPFCERLREVLLCRRGGGRVTGAGPGVDKAGPRTVGPSARTLIGLCLIGLRLIGLRLIGIRGRGR